MGALSAEGAAPLGRGGSGGKSSDGSSPAFSLSLARSPKGDHDGLSSSLAAAGAAFLDEKHPIDAQKLRPFQTRGFPETLWLRCLTNAL